MIPNFDQKWDEIFMTIFTKMAFCFFDKFLSIHLFRYYETGPGMPAWTEYEDTQYMKKMLCNLFWFIDLSRKSQCNKVLFN